MSSSQGSDVVKGNYNNNNNNSTTTTAAAGKVGTLDEKIKKLTDLLGKSFRPEFIQAFSYLIELENQKQAVFKLPDEVNWPKLNYFTQQLKKILKNKKHLDFLINRLLAVNSHNVHGKSVHPISSTSGVGMGRKCANTNTSSLASKSAINELLDLNSRDHSSLTNDVSLNDADCFSLTHLLVRFAFKLIKFKNIPAEKANDTSFMHNLAELKLVLISCLADLSFYDDLKVQLLNDANLKCLFQLYANDTRLEIETGQKKYKDKLVQYKQPKNSVHLGSVSSKLASDQAMLMMIINSKSTPQVKEPEPKLEHFLNLENLKKLWTKMCRFSANLCQDKHAHKIKQLITDEFIVSINKFVEQLHQQHQQLCEQDKILNDSNKNETDIDFYFSLTRLLKYGCEQTTLKNLLLHNRLLVYLSKYIFKLNKNLVILNDSKTSAPQMCLTEKKDKTSTTTTITQSPDESQQQQQLQIAITKNYLVLFRDLIKQYLLLIDSWPQSAESTSTEFYNQIIEGNLIEHLLWLNMKKPQHLIEEKADAKATDPASLQFKFSQFSFHLLSKLCHEYHACRAEFGRVGGLNDYLAKIESLTDEVIATTSKLGPDVPAASMPAVLDEYEKLIDVLCVSCKESLNRLKLKENGHLLNLIKLQQKLKANKSDVNKVYKRSASTHVEFTLYNKVLAALCCFAHDQDSMNVLFSNGLIDSLLFYLTEIIESDAAAAGDSKEKDTTAKNSSKNFENQFERLIRSDTHRRISLKKFLFNSFSDTNSASKGERKGKKRKSEKLSNPSGPPSKIKRVASISPLQFSSTSPVYSEASDLNEVSGTQASTSPPTLAHSESYCSLSPTNFYSPSFSLSSPPIASRCNSAVMFQQQQQQQHQQSPNFYSTLSPSSSSPTYFNYSAPVEDENADEDDDADEYINEIQFSPSIPNESSSDCDTDTDSYGSFCSEELYTDAQESNANPRSQSDDDDGDEKHEEESLIELEPGNTTLTSTSSTNIESINRTEACVFYVLSQLSHYEKAPNYFLNNFESILVCLLNYLKRASVRNPRALRILNRLTKNPNFFRHFVLAQFPYKLKKIFFNYSPAATLTSSSSSTTNVNSKSETDMNLYLNSNKAFFDATIFFPTFECIENTLCNNLKSLCISSSDHGYSCLISMMKQRPTIADAERLCCALVAPFVLRNSKALYYLMFELNGLDLIIDCLLAATADDVDSNKFKSIICVRRMLVFVNYKRDLKQLRDNYESVRSKLAENWKQECSLHRDETPSVKFTFGEEDRRTIVGAKDSLAGRSEYFSLLLEGPLAKNLARDGADSIVVELTDVRYETFSIIMDMLKCRVPLLEPPKLDFKLTCDLTVSLVLACDRFFLNDLKEFFICLLVFKFMSLSTVGCLFKLAWQLNHTYLANASIEFLLSEFQSFTGKQNASQADEPSFDGFIYFLKTFLADIKPNSDSENVKSNANHHSLVDYFRKVFRLGLSEIIKNNYWKF